MTVASLSSQFSDVQRHGVLRDAPVPPAPYPGPANASRATRIGQTIFCAADVISAEPSDSYFVIRPFFLTPAMEFLASSLSAEVVKRLDVTGPPSPFGSSISNMLGETWRFFAPAGETRSYGFFVPSDGMGLIFKGWLTDMAGVPIPGAIGTFTRIWTAVGAAHALMVEQRAGRAA